MKKRSTLTWQNQTVPFIALILFLLFASNCFSGYSQTVTTDKKDYSPGSTAIITGTGWQGDTEVMLTLTHLAPIPSHTHDPITVPVNGNGNFLYNFYVGEQELGTTIRVVARGVTTGESASTTFTDAGLNNVTVSPAIVCSGQQVTVTYTVNNDLNVNNQFEIILSNINGNFLNDAITLRSGLNSNTSGSVSVTIPSNIASGSAYQIRVSSSSPTSHADSDPFTVNTAPQAFNVTGGGTSCTGTSGPEVALSGSETGVNYQLYIGGTTAVGAPVSGTGSALSLGNQAVPGTYSVTGSKGNCITAMSGNAVITSGNPPVITSSPSNVTACPFQPITFSVQASGNGLTYQWMIGSTSVPNGTGWGNLSDVLSLMNQYGFIITVQGLNTANLTITGNTIIFQTYNLIRCQVTNSTGCSSASDQAVININDGPQYQYNVTGGGSDCVGGPGFAIGLDASESGVTYELMKNGSTTGTNIQGTGFPISFGNQTISGTYSAVAVKNGCRVNMIGSAVVEISSTPTPVITTQPADITTCPRQQATFSVTATGDNLNYQWQLFYVSTSQMVDINQEFIDGLNTLYNSLSNFGTIISMQGFNTQTLTISSYVSFNDGALLKCKVTNSAGCSVVSSGATLTIKEGPIFAINVSDSGPYCAGSPGTVIYLAPTEPGTTYELWRDGSYTNTSVTAISNSVMFGLQTVEGTYTVVASKNGCRLDMNGSAVVSIIPSAPAVEISGNGVPCSGSVVTYAATQAANVTYSWTLPSGWTGSSQSNIITVIAGSGVGNVTVAAYNSCGEAGPTASIPVSAQTCTENEFTTSSNFTVPAGVTVINVKAWGGGGSGGSSTLNSRGGGGGGAFATSTLQVTPGSTYNIIIGSGGKATTNSSAAGGNTIFGNNLVIAAGGAAGDDNSGTGGSGGNAGNCIGTIVYSGGNGGNGSSSGAYGGGGGGGSAYENNRGQNGGDGANGVGGAGGSGTGNGGDGGVGGSLNGSDGSVPGGGGGGNASTGSSSGSGADGQIILTYTTACDPPVITTQPSSTNQTICTGGTSTTLTVSATGDGVAYQWYSNASASNSGGTAVNGATSSSFTPLTSTAGTLYYYCLLKKTCSASVTSNISGMVKITQPPLPSITGSTTVCQNNSALYTTDSGNSNYVWNIAGGTITSGGGTGNNTATIKWTASGTQSLTVSYTNPSGCTGTSSVYYVTVNPIPNVTPTPSSQDLCSGSATSIALSSNVANAAFNWTIASTGVNGASAGSGNSIAQTLSVPGNDPGSVTYTVTPTSNGCSGTPFDVNIRVNPIPSVNAVSNLDYCNGSIAPAITFSTQLRVKPNPYYYSWTSTADVGFGTTGIGFIPEFTAANSGTTAVTATVSVTAAINDCQGPPMTFTVTVKPAPNVTPTPVSLTVCSGTAASTNLSGTVSGTTFNWTVSQAGVNGASGGTGNTISQVIYTTPLSLSEILGGASPSPGTAVYTITPAANGCTGPAATFTATVNPLPSAAFFNPYTGAGAPPILSQTICSGNPITEIAMTSNIPGTTFEWTRDNTTTVTGINASGSGNISGALSSMQTTPVTVTFTIIPSANGCSGSPVTSTVLVNPTPNVTALPSAQTICSGANTSSVLTGTVSGTTFSWTVDQSIDLGASAGTGFSISQTLNITQLTLAQALAMLSGTAPLPATAVYTITPTANGCNGPASTFTARVNYLPSASATPASQTVCSGSPIAQIVPSSGFPGATLSWTRDNNSTVTGIASSGTGNISGTLTNTLPTPVLVTFTITASANGCDGTPVTATVLVNPTPSAGFFNSVSGIIGEPTFNPFTGVGGLPTLSQTICSGNSITQIVLTSNISGTTYEWTRDKTTTVTGITASGSGNIYGTLSSTQTTPVTVTFTITPWANGCSGSPVIALVVVNPTPTLTSSLAPPAICSGDIFNYTPTSGTTGTSFAWSRAAVNGISNGAATGTGNVSEVLINTTAAPVSVTYVYTLTANGCTGSTATFTATVNPTPTVTPSPASQTICSGVSTSAVLSDAVSGTTFSWTVVQTSVSGASASSGTSISQSLTATGTTAGTAVYTITPTANGCVGPASTYTATVNPRPVASTEQNSQTVCSGIPITQILLGSNVAETTFSWTRNNATLVTGIGATGTGNINGTFNHTQTTPVTVVFTVTPSAKGCAGIAITPAVTVKPLTYSTNPVNVTTHVLDGAYFSVTATGTDPVSYQWQVDPKTGSFVSVNNVTGLYSGVTTNKLSLTNVPYSMDGYKYRCIVAGGCGTSVTTSPALLTVSLRPTALVYGGDLTKQYSDQVYLKAVLTDVTTSTPVPIPGKTVTFAIGTQTASDTYASTGGGTDASGIAEAYMVLTQKPASSFVISTFAGDAVYASANDKDAFAILCENATVTYNGASYFGAAPSTRSGLISFSATITDNPDGYAGNITNATATFHDGSATGTVLGTSAIPVGLTGTSTTEGSASTSMAYTLSSADISSGGKIWEVWTTVNNYYCGQSDAYNTVTLGMPGGDNVTGGGFILMTNTSGQYPGLNNAGRKMNFGLVMKWNKSAKNLQGKVNVIYRGPDGNNYQIKSNAINSIVVTSVDNTGAAVTKNATYKMATISTKATLTKLTSSGSVSLGGNLNLTVIAWESLTDKTGKSDRISVQLAPSSGSGMLFSSNWSGGKTLWQLLNGGKIQAFDSQTTTSYVISGESTQNHRKPLADTTFVTKTEFGLNVYPNPFTDKVSFDLRIQTDSRVTLEICNIVGTRIATVFDQHLNAEDSHRIEYTPENVSSGMLIYRILLDGRVAFIGKLIHE